MIELSSESLPRKVKDRFGIERVRSVIFVDTVESDGGVGEGDILEECRICGHGNLVYSLASHYHLDGGGSLLWINNVWAWRCSNQECNAPTVFKPEVREEIREKIKTESREYKIVE